MPACPTGAHPKPGISAGTVILQLTQTAMGDVAAMIGGLWGELAVQPVIMRMSLENLCNLNPTDPGPPTVDDLAACASFFTPFVGTSLSGGIPSWLLKQVQYHYFHVSCDCNTPTDVIPPRQPVPMPPNEPHYPTDHDSQPIAVRIEQNQNATSDALYTLYNGIMELNAQVGDLSWYARPNFIGQGTTPVATITGEGLLDLDATLDHYNYLPGDYAGVRVEVIHLPDVYKVRGTVVPRYYGIGSLMWLTDPTSSLRNVVSHRESIHYINQFVPMPREAFHPRLGYRLMPGAQVRVFYALRSINEAFYGNRGWHERALLQLANDTPPADFIDPPFYPKSSTRTYSLPTAPT